MSIKAKQFIPQDNWNWETMWTQWFKSCKPKEQLKVGTWNANGNWQCSRIEAFKTMREQGIDILAVQETRTNKTEKTSQFNVLQTPATHKNSKYYLSSG